MKKAKLSTGWIVGISVLAILLVLVLWVVGVHNSLVNSEINVDNAWSKVETVYQRRVDLIPNLVETVKGAKNFEQETILGVTEARSAWTSASTPQEKTAAANQVESSLSRLLVVVENYPDLKSNQNFLSLQDELANTENKIAVERSRYNDAVSDFNKRIKTIPSNIVAGMFNFEKRTFFEAETGAENAPDVNFN